MSLGLSPHQTDLFATTTGFCEPRLAPESIYSLLHRECHRLLPDELFADLFAEHGRNCVAPRIVAVVMVLQRLEGCSDREAVERFTYDVRWKYAAGGLGFDYPGFSHTVLVDMRARLRASKRPERIFEGVLETAKAAGLVGRRRVLDSTCLYDAVATIDTVTLIRCAIRGLLGACDADLERELRGLLARDDDYATAGKPVCDYEDRAAREDLIDALAKDAHALLAALDGREASDALSQAGALLASVVGQDLDEGADGVFRIARRVAKDRVISTVDPDARHGHKTSARGFDGYKGHVAVDPDSELITATTVTAGNVGDAQAVDDLLADDLAQASAPPTDPNPAQQNPEPDPAASTVPDPAASTVPDPAASTVPDPAASTVPDPADASTVPDPAASTVPDPAASTVPDPADANTVPDPAASTVPDPAASTVPDPADANTAPDPAASTVPDPAASTVPDPAATTVPDPADANAERDPAGGESERLQVYGDAAYGAGTVLETLENADAEIMCKVQPPVAPAGRLAKDAFTIDLQARTVTCPAGQTATLRTAGDRQIARFAGACHGCPLAAQCTTSTKGRTIHIGPHEQQLTRARKRQRDPDWKADYTATRPKVERKIAHLVRRKHGGRRARVRGQTKVNADFALLAAAVNLARLATLGLTHQNGRWATHTT